MALGFVLPFTGSSMVIIVFCIRMSGRGGG
jgi:hypothetical protein